MIGSFTNGSNNNNRLNNVTQVNRAEIARVPGTHQKGSLNVKKVGGNPVGSKINSNLSALDKRQGSNPQN